MWDITMKQLWLQFAIVQQSPTNYKAGVKKKSNFWAKERVTFKYQYHND